MWQAKSLTAAYILACAWEAARDAWAYTYIPPSAGVGVHKELLTRLRSTPPEQAPPPRSLTERVAANEDAAAKARAPWPGRLHASACVERGDLLDLLCGPPPPTPAPKPRTEWFGGEDECVWRDAHV